MTSTSEKTRYIPFRKKDIADMILGDGELKSKEEISGFRKLFGITGSIFHFEFHELLEKLKDSYFPVNPDLEKKFTPSPEDIETANRELHETMKEVLNDANFDQIPREEIEKAFNESALVGFSVKIDFKAYDFAEIYTRGRRKEEFILKKLFGFKKVETEHEILERVVLLARLKPGKKTSEKKRKKKSGAGEKKRSIPDNGVTFIKMFKDVPLEDLEILFPNSRITMSLKDKLMLAVPAIAGGVPLLATKVLPALIVAFVILSAYLGIKGTVEEDQLKQAVAVFSALGALGGFIFKQWSKYKTKKFLFQKELSDNLYFRNLVNNAGVFYSLIDSAEEEECKEAFLAYYFLYIAGEPLTENELDRRIEHWMEEKHGCIMDFECGDALSKLKRLEVLEADSDGRLSVKDLNQSLSILDNRWDNFFQY